MFSNLSWHQRKTGYPIHNMLYVNLMVTTKKKLILNIQKKMKKESKHDTKENHKTKGKRKKGKRK